MASFSRCVLANPHGVTYFRLRPKTEVWAKCKQNYWKLCELLLNSVLVPGDTFENWCFKMSDGGKWATVKWTDVKVCLFVAFVLQCTGHLWCRCTKSTMQRLIIYNAFTKTECVCQEFMLLVMLEEHRHNIEPHIRLWKDQSEIHAKLLPYIYLQYMYVQ